jgi:hypothetical protein
MLKLQSLEKNQMKAKTRNHPWSANFKDMASM